jgi:DNA-binding beta-propeller fold protein YncE
MPSVLARPSRAVCILAVLVVLLLIGLPNVVLRDVTVHGLPARVTARSSELGADPPAPVHMAVTRTTVIANGSVLNGDVNADYTSFPLTALYDNRTHDVQWVASRQDWIVVMNSTNPGNFSWLNFTGPGIDTAVYDPLTSSTYVAEGSGEVDRNGRLAVFNDSTYQVHENGTFDAEDAFADTTNSNGSTVFFAAGSDYYGAWITAVNATTLAATISPNLQAGWAAPPTAVAYASISNELFVAEPQQDVVQVLSVSNVSNMSVIANLQINDPVGLAYDSSDSLVYVGSGSGGIFGINSVTNEFANNNTSTPGASSLVFDAYNDYVYVLGEGGTLAAVNGSTGNPVFQTVPGAEFFAPQSLSIGVFNPSDDLLFAGGDAGAVLLIWPNNGTVERILWTGGFDPGDLSLNPANGLVYVDSDSDFGWVNGFGQSPDVLNATTGEPVAWVPEAAATASFYDPVTTDTILERSQILSMVNSTTNKIVRNVTVPSYPVGYPLTGTFDPSDGMLYVLTYDGVGIYNATNFNQTGILPYNGTAILYLSEFNELLIADGNVLILNASTNNLITTVNTGSTCDPVAFAFDPANELVYVANGVCGAVSVFNATNDGRLANIGVPDYQATVTYDPQIQAIVATGPYNNELFVIAASNDSLEQVVPVGGEPNAAIYDPASGDILVVNEEAGTVLTVGSPLELTEVGSTPEEATVDQPVTIFATVEGGMLPLTYTYSGLPPGCTSENASQVTCSPTSTGPYAVEVSVTDSAGGEVSASYNLDVVEPLEMLSFFADRNPVAEYQQVDLSANVTGGWGGYSYAYSGLPAPCATQDTAILSCTPSVNGTFEVSVKVTDGGGATVTDSVILVINPPLEFGVVFTEVGLPPGTSWGVTLGGLLNRSTSSVVAFDRINGSYAYNLSDVIHDGQVFSPTPNAGTVPVSGMSEGVRITFALGGYTVFLREAGLFQGQSWTIRLTGSGYENQTSSSSPTISFAGLLNGEYNFSIQAVTGFIENTSQATFEVNGGNVELQILFNETFSLEFAAIGLPIGTSWTLQLNGASASSASPEITYIEPNGTYAFRVETVTGYLANPSGGVIKLNDSGRQTNITFKLVTPPPPVRPGPSSAFWIWIGAGVLAAAVACVLIARRWLRPAKKS